MGREPHPDRVGLLQMWEVRFGAPPPPYLSVPFMQKALYYEAQCRMANGLSAVTRRALKRIAQGEPAQAALPTTLSPGAHLFREWNGRTYQVEVAEDGFVLDGETWRSLSAIARHITGANWSGPRFFGLTASKGSHS